ncbi:hypothetical protein ACSNN9_21675 [Micromonospora sp. URMC 107]|uniref:hypothetical protein n=1 Tax=Micromonospora sp. URMC 107 TaxID=3423418 RepID=UPI003F1CCFAD
MTAAPTAPPAAGPASTRARLVARALSELLSPPILLAVIGVVVAVQTATTLPRGLLAGATALLFGGVLPMAWILTAVRRGGLTDHHITKVRRQRHLPLAVSLACVLAGAGLLAAMGAWPVAALFLLTAATLVPSMVVTVWWQVSIHSSVAASTALFLIALWGPWAALGLAVVVALGWSRLALRAHTLPQVVVGMALGVAVGVGAWPLLA